MKQENISPYLRKPLRTRENAVRDMIARREAILAVLDRMIATANTSNDNGRTQ